MTIARRIDREVLVVVAVVLALPASARANPLLSGYGAPGQGSQVLLGSTLTGPHAGGGSAGAEGTGASGIEASSASARAGATHTQGGPAGTRTHGSTRSHEGASAGGTTPGGGGPTGLRPARSVSTDTAGLSSGDLALILIGIGVIAATAILMARLARGEERGGRSG